jgi:hypothetical protein
MIYEIDSDLLQKLSPDERQAFAKILAIHSAEQADRQQQVVQAELRRRLQEPNPATVAAIAHVAARAEQDRITVYVPGNRGRRTIVLNPVPPKPIAPKGFFERVWKWFQDFPVFS